MMDKFIFGVLISSIFLCILVGPIYFFSDIGGFIQTNPVNSGQIYLSFVINKTISESELQIEDSKEKYLMGNAEKLDLEDFKDFSSITSLGDADAKEHQTKADSTLSSMLYYKVWEN